MKDGIVNLDQQQLLQQQTYRHTLKLARMEDFFSPDRMSIIEEKRSCHRW